MFHDGRKKVEKEIEIIFHSFRIINTEHANLQFFMKEGRLNFSISLLMASFYIISNLISSFHVNVSNLYILSGSCKNLR